jgi:RHS repeat-associated protein
MFVLDNGFWARPRSVQRPLLPLTVALIVSLLVALLPTLAFGAPEPGASPAGGIGTFGGGISGTVDETTGAAVTAVPIEVPTARGVPQVNVALTYSSTRGLGDIAVGWSLGMPSIERRAPGGKRPRFLPGEHEHYAFAGRPLVRIGVVQSTSCPATDCTEKMPSWAIGATYFRLQDESSFGRLFLMDGRMTWRVQFKSGEIWEFGYPLVASNAFAISDEGGIDWRLHGITNEIARWNLTRKYEAYSGAEPSSLIVYGWQHIDGHPVGVLTDVFDTPYTTNVDVLSSYAHHVRLVYERHPGGGDGRWRHNAAVWAAAPRTGLKRIDVTATSHPSVSRSLVRRYHLSKEVIANRPYLTMVLLEGRCPEPIEEEYVPVGSFEAENLLQQWVLPDTTACPQLENPLIFDYTKPEPSPSFVQHAIPLAAAGGPEPPDDGLKQPARAAMIDVDGDGLSDIVERKLSGTDQPHVYMSRRSLFWANSLEYNRAGFTSPDDTRTLLSAEQGVSLPGQWSFAGQASILWRPAADPPAEEMHPYHRVDVTRVGPHDWEFASNPSASGGQHRWFLLGGDLDGDGLSDAVFRDNRVCYSRRDQPTKSVHVFGPEVDIECYTTDPIITSQRLPLWTLADMNGDGMADLVRSVAGTPQDPGDPVRYYPGDGDRGFGCTSRMDLGTCQTDSSGGKFVQLVYQGTQVPLAIDPTGHIKTLFGDVTGDGRADVVYLIPLAPNSVRIKVLENLDGRSFAFRWEGEHHDDANDPDDQFWECGLSAILCPGTLDLRDDPYDKIARGFLADVDGSGIASLVLVAPGHARIVDFHHQAYGYADAPRPGLLKRIRNKAGAEVSFTYMTGADIEARQVLDAGHPWHALGRWDRHSPHSLVVVTQINVTNSLPAPYGKKIRTRYDYRNPAFDPWTGEILGFELRRVTQEGDSYEPSLAVETTSFFDKCPSRDQQNTCPATTDDYGYRGLLGRPVLIEVFNPESGTFFSTTHIKYQRKHVHFGTDGRQSEFVYAQQIDTFVYDPTVTDAPALWIVYDVDDVLPRQVIIRNRGAHLRQERELDKSGNLLSEIDWGRIQDDGTPIDRPIHHDLTPTLVSSLESGGWIWRTGELATYYGGGGDASTQLGPDPPPRRFQYAYDFLGHLVLTFGQLTGTLPLERSHEHAGAAIAPTPPGAASDGWIALDWATYGPDGTLIEMLIAPNKKKVFDYTGDPYNLRPTSITDYTGECPTCRLTTTIQYDSGFGIPTRIQRADGAPYETEVDAFGRVVSIRGPRAVPSAATTLDQDIAYLEKTDGSGIPIVRIQNGASAAHDTYIYVDGFGQPFLTLHDADPSEPTPFVASGLTMSTARGTPYRFNRPWFYSGHPLNYPLGQIAPTFAWAKFDPLGRLTEVHRDGRRVEVIEHHALWAKSFDADALDPTSNNYRHAVRTYFDGHGRIIETRRPFYDLDAGTGDAVISLFGYAATGELNGLLQKHQTGFDQYRRWMRYDSLGRLVQNGEPHAAVGYVDDWNSAGSMKSWRYAYDSSGQLVGTSDPRGCGENLHYDRAGRLLAEDYSPCLEEHEPYTSYHPATGNGSEVLYTYDAPEPGQTMHFGASPDLLRGRLTSTRDRGAHTRFAYDGRGRVVGVARRIAKPGPGTGDIANRYATHWFQTNTTYDEFDRVGSSTTGAESLELLEAGASWVGFDYSYRGLLNRVNSSYGLLIRSQKHDADGAIRERVYGDLARTRETFEYDNERRLVHHQLFRVGGPWLSTPGYTPPSNNPSTLQPILLAHTFSYDLMNQVKEIADLRVPDHWPVGAKPTSRSITHDGLHRVRSVHFGYNPPGSTDDYVSPFAAEESASNSRPLPHRVPAYRPEGTLRLYDWFGNTTQTSDSALIPFDRSLGLISNDWANKKPGQFASSSAENGDVDAKYDATGHLIDLRISRAGACSGPMHKCFQRFVYEWNEIGQLSCARRWDYSTLAQVPIYPVVPPEAPAIEISFKYGTGGRVLKSYACGPGSTHHTAYVFPSLKLQDASYDPLAKEYQQDATTEKINLAGIARVVYDPQLPNSTKPRHIFLEAHDELGSPVVVIDKDTSELVERVTYFPFGATESDYRPPRWGSFREDRRFTGKEEDVEVGLIYFAARYFSAYLNRWISPDPLTIHGAGGDLNPYAYVGGRLFNAVDPFGLDACDNASCPPDSTAPPASTDDKGLAELWDSFKRGVSDFTDSFKGYDFSTLPNAIGQSFSAIGDLFTYRVAPGVTKFGSTVRSIGAYYSPAQSAFDDALALGREAMQPGATITARGYATGVANVSLSVARTATGAIVAPLMQRATITLPTAQPGDLGPHVAEFAIKHVVSAVTMGAGGNPVAAGVEASKVGAEIQAAGTVDGVAATAVREGGANIVYRGLAAGENPAAGLVARAPMVGNNPVSHVGGARPTQWISTTRSLEIAQKDYGRYGVVAIDLSKVPFGVVDLTRGIPGYPPNVMLSRWAIKAQEVLIQVFIPAEAITPVP